MANDGGGGARLHAVSSGDDPTARLAQHLSAMFASMGVSQRAYAASRHYDHSGLSRYFSGQRVPDWDFIETLMNDLAGHRGLPVTDQVREHTRQLYLAALQGGNRTEKHRYDLEVLKDELNHAADQARLREQDLLGQINGQEQRIEALTRQLHNLTGARISERENLRRQLADLANELHHLRDELHRARQEREAAEAAEADYGQRARELAVLGEEATGASVISPPITRDSFSGPGSDLGTASPVTPTGRTAQVADVTLDDLVKIAQSVPDPGPKAAALAEVAAALATSDWVRARNLFADAARIAESVPELDIKSWAIGFVAHALAPFDWPWASQLYSEAEGIARRPLSWDRFGKWFGAEMLAQIAEMMIAPDDPHRAQRLFADAVQAAGSWPLRSAIADRLLASPADEASPAAWERLRTLTVVAKMRAPSDPDQAEEITQSITDPQLKAEALAAVARVVAASDRDRANRLIMDADRAAQSLDPAPRDWALAAMGAALTAWNLDEAWRLTELITQQEPKAELLMETASALAVWDPGKAAELAWTIPSDWLKSCALANIAEAIAASDPGRAERLALSIPDPWKRASALAHIAKLRLHRW